MHVGSSPTWGTMKKLIIQYKDFILKVHASENNTCIQDSYKVRGIAAMHNILWMIQSEVEDASMAINKRGIWSMTHEWRAHNLLYYLGIEKDRTRSVDLNLNQPWYIRLGYKILSLLYLHY